MLLTSQENIENKILENYSEWQYLFLEIQSKFLSGLYSRYQSLENGNLVLYYAKQSHQGILRLRDYDFNFNISFEKFWENHLKVSPKQISIIKVGAEINIPKETARRKISELIKQKVLNRRNKNIGWLPNEHYKQSYSLFINEEIKDVSKMINFVCEKNNISVSNEETIKMLKEKFSFYWFHYLETQLEYLRLWSKQLNDLEYALLLLQVSHLFLTKVKKNLSFKDVYEDFSLIEDFPNASISATSISDVTSIPRATCIRKLEFLVKLKLISQDKITKRYYLNQNSFSKNLISQKTTESVVKLFSKFLFICIRGINFKT